MNNRALKLFEIENNNALVTEYIFGKEYSADIFYFKGKISLVRLCKKEIVFIHETPCTAVYQLLNPNEKIKSVLEKWCNTLFEKENISFGQFDFIEDCEDDFVPIDFAPRVGGGIEELLKCCMFLIKMKIMFFLQMKIIFLSSIIFLQKAEKFSMTTISFFLEKKSFTSTRETLFQNVLQVLQAESQL